MLIQFYPVVESTSRCGNLSQKIRLLVSHGADIGVRDKYGMTCLHALMSHVIVYSIPETWTEIMMDPLCLLVQLGADIHAVTHSGYSVTEWAHCLRRGHAWEEALEKAGYDVERVYLEDFNRGWSIADDVFAPDEGHRRRRGVFSSQYYNLSFDEKLDRVHYFHRREIASEDELDEPEDGTSSEEEEEELDDGEDELNDGEDELDDGEDELDDGEEERDHIMGLKEHRHGSCHGFVDENPQESDSDEEMGGVPVTG